MISTMAVSVVVPVYRSTGTLDELVRRIAAVLNDVDHEVILVEDASGDDTWLTVAKLAAQQPNVTGLRLGRNAGQHSALLAGVRSARYEVTVTIDDDLQNPPEEIPLLLEALEATDSDVVYGVPREVAQAGWRKGSGWIVRRAMKTTLGVQEVVNMSSFRAFRTSLRDAFDVRIGPGVSLDSLLAWGSNRFTAVEVRHDERAQGTSHYSLGRLIRFAMDTVTGYTTVPLRAVSGIGFATAGVGMILMIAFVLVPFLQGISVQGFPFLASTIILFSGIQLVTLGVIGEYLARMHFRIMNKPEYVVAERVQTAGHTTAGDEHAGISHA